MKKLISLLLAIAIVMTFAVHVVAAELQTSTPAGNALIEGDEIQFDDLLGTEGEEEPDVTITSAPTGVECEVEGQTVTVNHAVACKVGYLSGDKYVEIAATQNPDGTYSFTAPEGVTDVVVVVKGDANGDGAITLADSTRAKAIYNNKTTADAKSQFAMDANNDGQITLADSTRIKAAYNSKTTLTW